MPERIPHMQEEIDQLVDENRRLKRFVIIIVAWLIVSVLLGVTGALYILHQQQIRFEQEAIKRCELNNDAKAGTRESILDILKLSTSNTPRTKAEQLQIDAFLDSTQHILLQRIPNTNCDFS